MLVHPEISAILNRLSQSKQEAPKSGPRVARGDKAGKGGLDKPKEGPAAYAQAAAARDDEIDFLNERESKVSCYA